MAEPKKIRIQYYRSAIATPTKHKLVIKGLGFTRLNQIVERVDNESCAAWSRRCRTWFGSSRISSTPKGPAAVPFRTQTGWCR